MDFLIDDNSLCACPQCGFSFVDRRTDISDPASKEDVGLLLHSNDPPPEAVEHDLRQQYVEAQKYSNDLDSQIVRLQRNIQVLSQERNKVQGFLGNYKTVLHPVRRLPGDVLNLIFTLSYKPPDITKFGEDWDMIAYYATPAWILAQVCQSWRHYATSLGSLWSFVSLDLEAYDNAHVTRNWRNMLALQVERIGNYPITLHVQSEASSSSRDTLMMRNWPPLAIMFSTSQRWKSLRLNLSHSELLVLNAVKGSLQSLQELQIDLPRKCPDLSLIDAFEFAPALEKLVLGGKAELALQIALPWSQLREFRWSARIGRRPSIDNKVHLDLLSQMPNLRYCSLHNVIWSSDVARAPLKMLSLQTLKLRERTASYPSSLDQILHALYAPCLEELQLLGPLQQTGVEALQDFIQRSGSPLRILNVRNLNVDSLNIIALLSSLPVSIQTLVLGSKSGLDDTVFYALRTHDLGKHTILPKLKALDIRGTKRFSDDAFLDMLESRVMPRADHSEVTPLEILRIAEENVGYRSLLNHARLLDLRSEGLRVVK